YLSDTGCLEIQGASLDILRLCVSYSLKQIAIIKGIDYKTISYHKIRALNKLNIKGTV
ncbi:hypothetical protein NPL45_004954, partial [Escherichia coli]|nr:hypothetical protein [Escherichia coli]